MRASVEARFSRAADTYQNFAAVQELVARELATRADVSSRFLRVLEVGAGTGFLSRELLKNNPLIKLLALDISADMLGALRTSLPEESRLETHTEDLFAFSPAEPFDAILSASALHWCGESEAVFKKLKSLLGDGGLLHAAIMVKGTLGELHELRARLFPRNRIRLSLPTAGETVRSFRDAGFSVRYAETKTFIEEHPTIEELFTSLRLSGVTGGDFSRAHRPLLRAELLELMDEYEKQYSTALGVKASYEVLFLGGIK